MELKVVTWNIHHGCDQAEKPTLSDIAVFLKEIQPDIISLNEVDVYNPRSRFRHQARFLARCLGYNYFFAPSISWGPVLYGNAILTRGAISSADVITLPSTGEPRCCLVARILFEEGPRITFCCTHLGLQTSERTKQLKKVIWDISHYHGPLILAGDFNTSSVAEVGSLIDIMTDCCQEREGLHTYPSSEPRQRIDFIFCSKHFAVKTANVPQVPYSDHLPVRAILKF